DPFAEISHEALVATAAVIGEAEHLTRLLARLLGDLDRAFIDEAFVAQHVGPGVEEDAIALDAIATSTTDLLIVAFDGTRHIPVDHVAHVALVDAHAERDRGHDHVAVVVAKLVLHARALAGLHARVIAERRDAARAQVLGHAVDRLAREAVDD